MAAKIQASKKEKAAKAMATSRKEKKKWTVTKKEEVVRKTVTVSDELLARVEKELGKAVLVSPYSLGAKHNINISVAKNLLRHFEQAGVVEKVYSSPRMCGYSAVKKAQEEAQIEAK
jgi:small subunit ribosomal protein S25e